MKEQNEYEQILKTGSLRECTVKSLGVVDPEDQSQMRQRHNDATIT